MDKGDPLMEQVTYPDGFQEYRQVEGLNGEPLYRSKLGDLGLYGKTTDRNGKTCYRIKNDKGEVVTQCSETGNLITRTLGVPTTGDAWTRHGVYGDTLIYGEKDHNKPYNRYINKVVNGLNPSDINPDELQSGDFVDLLKGANNASNKLAESGRGNSHTGTIFKPYGNEGPAYVIHNTGGDIYIDPLNEFGKTKTWTIMSVRRPGTKENPYDNMQVQKNPEENKNQNIRSSNFRISTLNIKPKEIKLNSTLPNNYVDNLITNTLISKLPYKFELDSQKLNSEDKSNFFNNNQVQKNWKGIRGKIDEESLKMLQTLGIQTENAKEAQKALNHYIKNKNLKGKIREDNAWGSQSKKALTYLYLKNKKLPSFNLNEEN